MKTLAERTTTPARSASAAWHQRPRVSAPTDASERDADRMADEALRDRQQVVPTSAGSIVSGVVQRQANDDAEPSTGGPPAPYPDERDDDWDDVAAASRSVRAGVAPIGFASAVSASAAGAPMPGPLQARMETAFGRSFEAVRVHADAGAGQLADSINARAFTRGNDVYFGPGEYAPATEAGDRLLAHELGHTIQQSGGEVRRQKKKGDNKRSRSPYDPSRMTDEEKIRLRVGFHEAAKTQTQLDRDEFEADRTINAADRAEWAKAIDDALASAHKISDDADREPRVEYLQAERRLLDDDFYAWVLTHRKLSYSTTTVRRIGDPTSGLSKGYVNSLRSHAASMRAGADAYMTFLAEVSLYQAYEVQPSELETAETAESEGLGGLPGTGGASGQPGGGPNESKKRAAEGAIGGETLEERKVLEEMHAALGDLLTSETPTGDQELLIHQLEQMTPDERKDFYDFVRGQIESQPPGGEGEKKTLTDLIDQFRQLDPAEREALRVNREILEREPRGDKPIPKHVLMQLKEQAAKQEKQAEDVRSLQRSIDIIRGATRDPDAKKELQDLNLDGADTFFEEIAMLQGLLAGAGRESDLVRDVGIELIKEIVHFQEKLRDELRDLAIEATALALLTVITEGAASPALVLLLRRIKQVKKLIDTLRRIYSIYDRIQQVISVVQGAGEAYSKFRGWYETATTTYAKLEAQLESLEGDEDLEEALEAQEEKLLGELEKQLDGKFGEILELLYIPEDTPPDELRKILFNIPPGITELEGMWDFYRNGKRNEHFAEVLMIKAFGAGRLLYPLVGLTAALVAEQLAASFPRKSFEERMERLISKSKRGKGLGKRNRSLFGRLQRKHYDYDSKELQPHLDRAVDKLRAAIDDDEPGTGTSEHWAPAWFKTTVRREIREVNKQFKSIKVTATRKEKKPGGGTTKVKEAAPLPSFRVRVKRPLLSAKRLEAVVKINPEKKLEVDRLTNDDFVAGVDYRGTPEKRKEAIRKWLRDAGYELIKDNNGAEHIRLPGGKQASANQSYLHFDRTGKIKADINKEAFKDFLGRVVHDSKELPEGYHIYQDKNGNDVVSLKGKLGRTPGFVKLGLEPGHKLVVGGKGLPAETKVQPGVTKPEHPRDTESYDYVGAIEAMFAAPTTGAAELNLQVPKTKDKWTKHVAATPGLRRRPKAVKGRLGYVLRARQLGDRTSSHHLPGLQQNDDRGHIIARRFGGVDDYDNLVPMLRRENQFPGKWFGMESEMADIYIGKGREPNHVVDFELSLIYPSSRTRRPRTFVARFHEVALKAGKEDRVGGAKSKTIQND